MIKYAGCNIALPLVPLLAGAQEQGQKSERPNILFIAVDDLKPTLGCHGNRQLKTPNIDRLAQRGTVFMNAYCQIAVCDPSRASIMTGLYPDRTGVWDLKTKMRSVHPDIGKLLANSLPAKARVTNLRADPLHSGVLYATIRLKGIWKGILKNNRWSWKKIKDKAGSLAVWAWGAKTVIFNGTDISLDGSKTWKTVVDSEKLLTMRKTQWTNKKKNYLSISSPAGIGNKCFLTFHDWVFKRGFGEFQVTLNGDGTTTVKDITGDLPVPVAVEHNRLRRN